MSNSFVNLNDLNDFDTFNKFNNFEDIRNDKNMSSDMYIFIIICVVFIIVFTLVGIIYYTYKKPKTIKSDNIKSDNIKSETSEVGSKRQTLLSDKYIRISGDGEWDDDVDTTIPVKRQITDSDFFTKTYNIDEKTIILF